MPSNIVRRFARVYEKSRPRSKSHAPGPSSPVSPAGHDGPDVTEPPESICPDRCSTTDTPTADDLTDLWDEAVSQYRDTTGIDLHDEDSEPDLHRRLQGCHDVLKLSRALDTMASDFQVYRSSPKGVGGKIRRALRPIVRVALVVLDIGGEASAATGVPGGKALFVAVGVLLKTTMNVTKRFDAVASLLEKFSFYMDRLKISAQHTVEGALRAIIVEFLAHMLCSFAAVTDMMKQNRIEHFFSLLRGQEDGVTSLMHRAETLIEEQSRLILVESLHIMKTLSANFEDAHARLKTLSETTEKLNRDVRSSGLLQLPGKMDVYIAQAAKMEFGIARVLMTLQRKVEPQSDTQANHQRLAAVEALHLDKRELTGPTKGFMHAFNSGATRSTGLSFTCPVLLPCTDMASFSTMAGDLLQCFRGLSQEEQVVLKQVIIKLYAVAATSISGGSADNTTLMEVMVTGLMYPGAVMTVFLPMATIFIAVFAFWKCLVSTTQRAIPRTPGYAHAEMIFLVDVFGSKLVLHLEMCKSWDDIHHILLRHFSGEEVAEYVRSHAYQIMDSRDGNVSIIRPETWARTVQAGMTVEMSIILRRQQPSAFLRCPWCEAVAPPRASDNQWIDCALCHGKFWASQETSDNLNDKDDTLESQSASTIHTPVEPSAPQGTYSSSTRHPESGHLDISAFRRVTIVQKFAVFIPSLFMPTPTQAPADAQTGEIEPSWSFPAYVPDDATLQSEGWWPEAHTQSSPVFESAYGAPAEPAFQPESAFAYPVDATEMFNPGASFEFLSSFDAPSPRTGPYTPNMDSRPLDGEAPMPLDIHSGGNMWTAASLQSQPWDQTPSAWAWGAGAGVMFDEHFELSMLPPVTLDIPKFDPEQQSKYDSSAVDPSMLHTPYAQHEEQQQPQWTQENTWVFGYDATFNLEQENNSGSSAWKPSMAHAPYVQGDEQLDFNRHLPVHSGHTIAPCIIPPGTLLYHGKVGPEIPTYPDWLAFDSEHGYLFARWRGGHILTFATTRELRMLYFDGSSGTKVEDGSSDTQELLMFGDVKGRRKEDPWEDEDERIETLCRWARQRGLDGFVRMEIDFEAMYCNMTNGLKLISAIEAMPYVPYNDSSISATIKSPNRGPGSPGWDERADRPSSWRSSLPTETGNDIRVAANRHARTPGETRVHILYDKIITFYDPAVTSLLESRRGKPRQEHRLKGISKADADAKLRELDGVLGNWDWKGSSIDWRSLTHVVFELYAQRLETLAYTLSNATHPDVRTRATKARAQVLAMLAPHSAITNTPPLDADTADNAWLAPVVQRCASTHTAGIPTDLLTPQEALKLKSVEVVMREVCRRLGRMLHAAFDVESADWEKTRLKDIVDFLREEVVALMEWLDWTSETALLRCVYL
ncbi:unnamed protein product [Peniophora sp. CBMAI 1063]|nr:unnamed protein product [Peniophora sp. CBMAI 1063]